MAIPTAFASSSTSPLHGNPNSYVYDVFQNRDAASPASPSHGNPNSYVYDVFQNHRGPDVKKTLASQIYRGLDKHGIRDRDATSSASPSHGNPNSYVYDVFLNHRGPDVKTTLASHLYYRLEEHGLRAFFDKQELQKGEKMKPQIEGAIQTASVHIAIFSPNYAESSWCLNELVQMLESRKRILPVFYGVKPSDLRWTRGGDGVYARSLDVLEKETWDSQPLYDSNTIKKWRDALSEVADITGFELKAFNDDEGQLVDNIVQCVKTVFSGVELRRLDFSRVDFSGVDFSDFGGVDFGGVDFSGVDLSLDLSGFDLSGVDFGWNELDNLNALAPLSKVST